MQVNMTNAFVEKKKNILGFFIIDYLYILVS